MQRAATSIVTVARCSISPCRGDLRGVVSRSGSTKEAMTPTRRMAAITPSDAPTGIGLVWANAFEYFYHRYLLHHTRGALGKGHILHHITSGKENEVEHLTFGESPLYVMLLFSTNGSPMALADLLWGFALGPGILLGFTAYFIAVEEIHWRIHLGSWLPPGLRAARAYHLDHHDIPEGRYNVFCPLFDLLLGTAKSTSAATPAPRPRARRNIWRALQEEALLYTWIIGMAVFVRFFCGGSPKP